jgi:drug/metabolite transporter (DMT)-like permease
MFRAYGYFLVALALIGWVIYQVLIKKKRLAEISTEILFIVFFIGVWAAIYYWAMH